MRAIDVAAMGRSCNQCGTRIAAMGRSYNQMFVSRVHQGFRDAAYAATSIMSASVSCEASARIGVALALLRL
ncbi:MAG: hypothetical protein ACREPY_11215, partial [Rhodanobacteraceae bacterium]